MKTIVFLSGVLATVASAEVSLAQSSFGKPLDVSFGIERVFGFYKGETEVELPGADLNIDSSGFALGWSQVTNDPMPVNTPRFGLDVFVIQNLSVGGSLGFTSHEVEDNDYGGFLFAPRVGYFIDFNQHFGFWPRGGLTYYSLDGWDDDDDDDANQLFLALEGYFTFAPREGFGFLFGPTLDLGFMGEAGDNDMSQWSFGIMIGMFGWI